MQLEKKYWGWTSNYVYKNSTCSNPIYLT